MKKLLCLFMALGIMLIPFQSVWAEGKIRLVAGAIYAKNGNTLTITNPTMYTGILVQYGKDYKEILTIDFIDGTTTAWFSKNFTKPDNWFNTISQAKAFITGDFSELAKLKNWGTVGNVVAQTGAVFRLDLDKLDELQANSTTVALSQYAYSADYYIGGEVSLIVDAAKILLSLVPSDKLKTAKKDLRVKVLKYVFENQAIVANIRGLLKENKVSDAVIEGMLQMSRAIFAVSKDLFISEKAVENAQQTIISELEREFGIKVVESAVKGITLVGATLERLQKIAEGIDAVTIPLNYYLFDDFKRHHWSRITFKTEADVLESRKMETLATGTNWTWHSPERGRVFEYRLTSDHYQSSHGETCRQYDFDIYFTKEGSKETIRDLVACRHADGTWIGEQALLAVKPPCEFELPSTPAIDVTVQGNHVKASWIPAPTAEGYKLYYAPESFNEGNLSHIAFVDVGNQTVIEAALESGTQLYVAVQAYNCAGTSHLGHVVLVKTQAQSPATPGEVFRDTLTDGSLGPEMVWLPAGTFRMGDLQGDGWSDEQPVHEVSVSRFAMGKYEVTNAEFVRFLNAVNRRGSESEPWFETKAEDSSSHITGSIGHFQVEAGYENHPVADVSWYGAVAYAEWLTQQTGHQYRLPTEAEWEYAARAGTETSYWWGNKIGYNRANCDGCGSKWDDKQTAPVGSFPANPFGLHDTVGNLWEWTCSGYESRYNGKEQVCLDKESASDGSHFVLRGGSWNGGTRDARAAERKGRSRSMCYGDCGARLVRIP